MKRIIINFCISLILIACSGSDDSSNNQSEGSLSSISIVQVSNISFDSANVEVTILNDGGSNITQKGLAWSDQPNPDLNGSHTSDGEGNSNFISQLTNLLPSTTYFARAYATNSSGSAYSQEVTFTTDDNVYNGNVSLESQQEVIDFGANNYSEITGHLWIRDYSGDVSDLSPLLSLQRIGTELDISHVESLVTLDGLNNLKSVGSLVILVNENLLTLDGLDNLMTIHNYLILDQNISLVSFSSLENITSIPGFLRIWNNEALTDMNGLENIVSVGGYLEIVGNDVLPNLNGLQGLISVGSYLHISQNDALISLQGLSSLNNVGLDLYIVRNPLLEDFGNMNSLTSVNQDVLVDDNESLLNLDGLNGLEYVGRNFIVRDNELLMNTNGLSNLRIVEGGLSISRSHVMTEIGGFNNIESITNNFAFTDNDLLTDYCVLQTFLSGNGLGGEFLTERNAFNPTRTDIINGDCSL